MSTQKRGAQQFTDTKLSNPQRNKQFGNEGAEDQKSTR